MKLAYVVLRMTSEFYTDAGFTIEARNEETGVIGYIPVYKDETTAHENSDDGKYAVMPIEIKDLP